MNEFEYIATNDVTYWPVLWVALSGLALVAIGAIVVWLSDYGDWEGLGMVLVIIGFIGGLFGSLIAASAIDSEGKTEAVTAGLAEQDLRYLDREDDRWSAIAEDDSYVTGIWDADGRRYTFIVVEGLEVSK